MDAIGATLVYLGLWVRKEGYTLGGMVSEVERKQMAHLSHLYRWSDSREMPERVKVIDSHKLLC